MRGSEKALFNLRDIASDLDQDGTVTKDEQYVTNQLKAVANMDGDICGKQLYMLLLQFAAVRKGYRLVKCFAVLLIVACIAQAGATVGIVWSTGDYYMNADKKDAGHSTTVLTKGDNVVATAPAYSYLPIVAATAMDDARLDSVSRINVRFVSKLPPDLVPFAREIRRGESIKTGYQVIGWTRLSLTSIFFRTSTPGHIVRISNGRVQVEVVEGGNVTFSSTVCADDAECSALRVDSAGEADTLLKLAGVRRRLNEWADEDEWVDAAQVDPDDGDIEDWKCLCAEYIMFKCPDKDEEFGFDEACARLLFCDHPNVIPGWKCANCGIQHCSPPPPPAPPPSPYTNSAMCKADGCKYGDSGDGGGVNLDEGYCTQWCSWAGHCGTSTAYQATGPPPSSIAATDCRTGPHPKCKRGGCLAGIHHAAGGVALVNGECTETCIPSGYCAAGDNTPGGVDCKGTRRQLATWDAGDTSDAGDAVDELDKLFQGRYDDAKVVRGRRLGKCSQ